MNWQGAPTVGPMCLNMPAKSAETREVPGSVERHRPTITFLAGFCLGPNLQYPHRYRGDSLGPDPNKALVIRGRRQQHGPGEQCAGPVSNVRRTVGENTPATEANREPAIGIFGFVLLGPSVDVGPIVDPATAGDGHSLVTVAFFVALAPHAGQSTTWLPVAASSDSADANRSIGSGRFRE